MKFAMFDAYGTLVELDDFYGRLQRGFETAGVLLPADVVKQAARAEMQHYIAQTVHARTQADWKRLKNECADVLAETIRGEHPTFDLSPDRVLAVLEAALVFRVFPEVRAVLQVLQARGVRMGVLSNWDISLHNVLDELELSHFFDFVLVSAEVGVQKPQRAFFEEGLRLARRECSALEARDCFYVGDHYDGDVLGARGADLVPVWLVRAERDLASGETREDDEVLRIESLHALLTLCESKA
jgi:putative hydrolase of the HAD superfamily